MIQRLEAFLDSKAQLLLPQGLAFALQLNLRISLQVSTPRRLAPALPIAG